MKNMKKWIGTFVIACLLLVSMISITADENDECPCNGKGKVMPMAIHAIKRCCDWVPAQGMSLIVGTSVCRKYNCIRYSGSGGWHCGHWYGMYTLSYNICLGKGMNPYGCCWYDFS